jgi:N-acetylmuramic acid 6-phosphate etherase
VLQRCELQAFDALAEHAGELEKLRARTQAALRAGRNVYLAGCGATGRLSLTLEYLWRQWTSTSGNRAEADRVRGFTAGGDLALVRSVEAFEDYPAFGARQLQELGFTSRDLLIATTEGGETPFVIGATQEAASRSEVAPSFLFCNPAMNLVDQVERSRDILHDPRVDSLSLDVGPLVLSGSTRLQASTALMLAVGLALLPEEQTASIEARLSKLRDALAQLNFRLLAPFIVSEAQAFLAHDHVLYESVDYATTIFTDTTERPPTFNLVAFENDHDEGAPLSTAYFVFPGSTSSQEAWELLLARPPRALEWPGYEDRVGLERLYGYDFSENARARRARAAPKGTRVRSFKIDKLGDAIRWRLGDLRLDVPIVGLSPLFQHLVLKILLNTHSTLMMGRCGRFQGNVMTWVRPTNGKLIDRAVRYVQYLLESYSEHRFRYEEICRALFRSMESLTADESVVLSTFERLTGHPAETAAVRRRCQS